MNNEEETKEFMLTTVDNPYNPFTQFDEWFQFDVDNNYSTCSKIARLANIKDYMSNTQKDEETAKAIDRLIEIDPFDVYIKVYNTEKDIGEGV